MAVNPGATPLTLAEILRQPASWRQALEVVASLAFELKDLVQEAQPDQFLFTGCGTSYYLSIAAAGFFQERTGYPARAVPASELILSRRTHLPEEKRAVLVAFSRSGETTETVVALRQFRTWAAGPAIAVTCRRGSDMEKEADLTIALPAADDRSVVMTSSFTTMLLAADLLAAHLLGDEEALAELHILPDLLSQQLEAERAFAEGVGGDLGHRQFVFLGLGPFFGLASEAMLKLKEMTQVPCEAYSPLEFRHGPMSIVEAGSLGVLLASRRAESQEIEVLRDFRRLGGRTLRLGGAQREGAADVGFAVGDGLSELATGLLYMPLLQALAYYRAMALGRDPDQPQHLTRVVVLSGESLVGRGD